MGLWYPKTGQFPMTSYSDADYAGCRVNRKSTSDTCQFLRIPCFVVFQEIKFRSPLNRRGGVCCDRGLLYTNPLDETYSP